MLKEMNGQKYIRHKLQAKASSLTSNIVVILLPNTKRLDLNFSIPFAWCWCMCGNCNITSVTQRHSTKKQQ